MKTRTVFDLFGLRHQRKDKAVRALRTLQRQLDGGLSFMHAQRRDALWRVVQALLRGGMLWLTALGRFRSEAGKDKHGIKAVDRLLGNRALHRERVEIYAAMARWLVRDMRSVVVLVDVTELQPNICALTASLALCGRGVPIYTLVRRKRTIGRRRTLATFLGHLHKILPTSVTPIVVTDAGFESPWFDEVRRRGWHYVGRVRHQTRFLHGGKWMNAQALHALATDGPRSLGLVPFPRHRPLPRRLVLSQRPVPKGRRRLNTRGCRSNTVSDKRYRKSAREPWLLCTSLACSARQVVRIYGMRMQIEQNYRDVKNHRWGWQLDLSRSRSNPRLELLALIGALAMLATLATGAIAEHLGRQRLYQANTTRDRRVLSWFVLGVLIMEHRDPFLTARRFTQGIAILRKTIQALDPGS